MSWEPHSIQTRSHLASLWKHVETPVVVTNRSFKCQSRIRPIAYQLERFMDTGWYEYTSGALILTDGVKSLEQAEKKIASLLTTHKSMMGRPVTEEQALAFAEMASRCRWNKKTHKVFYSDLILPRREGQAALNSYNIYVTVLEALLEGGDYNTYRLTEGKNRPERKVRRIGDLIERRRLSKLLWAAYTIWAETL